MASLRVLAFDHEGRLIQFDTWLDDLQLYLLSESRDKVSLCDLVSGTAPAPPATSDSATGSQWLNRDAAARLAIRNHQPLGECPHFREHRTAQALCTPLEDLVSHLCTSDARYRAALLEQHLLAAETSVVAVGAARDTPHTPFFEGCSPSPLAPSYASAAAVDVLSTEDVGAGSANAKCCNSKGKGGRGGGGGSGSGGRGSSGGSGGSGGGGSGGSGGGSGGVGVGRGQWQRQQRRSETPSPQQLREWLFQHRASRGTVSCPSVIRTDDHAGQTCGKANTQHRCFFRLDDAWSAEFGDEVERPHWAELLRSGVAIFDLDYDAILSAMYALSASAEGECYRCVPADPGINAAALGASESVLPGIAPAEALHTFTLDSGASHCFFHDSTTLTPLPAPVLVRLADPFGGPVVARSSTVLPCPPVPSGSLSSPHLSLFSTNLVSAAAFHDAMVTTTTPGGQRCRSARVHRRVVSCPCQVAPPCSCRLLSHQTLLWHHRLGQPSLPRLRGMHSCLLISGLPRSLPPLLPSFASTCLPCIEGRQRAAPHSSSFPLMTAPLQTLHMDVWGPARVNGQGRERYFLLVVDDYTRYTTVFLLRSKGQVVDVLIPWICAFRLQFLERFCADLRVLRLLSDRGGKFSSNLFRDFCRGEGILQSFMLLDSPKQNGIAERRIGLVMEVARTSMIHAAAPHFLCPFAVRYAAHQLNLWPHISLPKTSPTLRWTGTVGDASMFRVWGSRAFVRDTSADKLSTRAIPCDPVPSGVSQVDPLLGTMPVEVAIGSGAAPGGAFGGAEPEVVESEGSGSGGAERGGEEPGGAEPVGVEPRGAESEGVEPGGAESGGVESGGAASSGRLAGASPRLSPQQLREWLVRCACLQTGATGAEGAGVTTGAGGTGGTAATGPGGARTRGTRAARTGGVGGAGAGDPTEPGVAGAGGCGAGGAKAGGAGPASPLRAPSPYREQSSELIERSEPASRLVSPVRPAHCDPRSRPPPVPDTHAMALRPSSVPLRVPLPAPPESSLPEVPDPESDRAHATSPTVSRLLTTAVTDPSFESAATSALVAELLDFAAACRLDYATALVAESESTSAPSVGGECTLGTDVLQDTKEVFECLAAAVPHFASMLLAPEGDPDAPDIPTPRSYAEAITGPYSSQWQAAMDAEMASWKSTGTYVDEVPPPRANIVDGMWIFRVKRPPGTLPAFKACYVARGFSQRQGVDYFQTFSPTLKMTTLWVLLHIV
ncbi:unnamed protein product [Closterium sp. NIES-54]